MRKKCFFTMAVLAICTNANPALVGQSIRAEGPDSLVACFEYRGSDPLTMKTQIETSPLFAETPVQWVDSCPQTYLLAKCLGMKIEIESNEALDFYFQMSAPDSIKRDFTKGMKEACDYGQGIWTAFPQP